MFIYGLERGEEGKKRPGEIEEKRREGGKKIGIRAKGQDIQRDSPPYQGHFHPCKIEATEEFPVAATPLAAERDEST